MRFNSVFKGLITILSISLLRNLHLSQSVSGITRSFSQVKVIHPISLGQEACSRNLRPIWHVCSTAFCPTLKTFSVKRTFCQYFKNFLVTAPSFRTTKGKIDTLLNFQIFLISRAKLSYFINILSHQYWRGYGSREPLCLLLVFFCSPYLRTLYQVCCSLLISKGKTNPLQAWTGPEGPRILRLPDISRQSSHEDGKFVRPTHCPPLSPRKYSWYSLILEAESTPGRLLIYTFNNVCVIMTDKMH